MQIEKTQIKFAVSKETGVTIGFVSRSSKTNKLKGVREDSVYGKKIVVLSENLKGKIQPNVLYEVELKEMHNGNGYVAVSAEIIKFPVNIELIAVTRSTYQIRILFGNKTIYFDPVNGRSPSSQTVQGVINVLRNRQDIENPEQVISEFRSKSGELFQIMKMDGVPYQSYIEFSE